MALWKTILIGVAVLAAVALGVGWKIRRDGRADLSDGRVPPTLRVDSASFADGGPMPARLTCDGAGLSPDVRFPIADPRARSRAVVVDDLDAPFGFTHWLAYDIAPGVRGLGEGASSRAGLTPPAAEGANDFGTRRYGGPCPPGGRHRYRISVYDLDLAPGLPPGLDKKQLAARVAGHILAEGRIVGTYARR